jgi:sec-independent protein translocase protein TatA
MLGSIGMPELLMIFAVMVLIFGPKRLPQMGRALGETIKEFRGVGKQVEDLQDEKVNL